MRVSLVHEWLTNFTGSEKVVDALRRCFPGAPVHTSMFWAPAFPGWERPTTTFLQRFATGPASHVRVLPAMPAAFRSLRITPSDLVVTSFHTFALHARVPNDVPHLVYCHTPPRFIWARQQLDVDRIPGRGRALALAAAALGGLDRRRAARPTAFVANSSAIADRIRRAYRREATVVHPPVDVARFRAALGAPRQDHWVLLSRLVPYKRVDLAVAAFAELGWPLVVAGEGRARAQLEATAPPNVRFLGRVDDAELPSVLASARGFVFPGEEDFGIAPVEAMAAGTPVIALRAGGALDTVVDGRSGVLFDEPTVGSLVAGLRRAADTAWDHADVSRSTDRFAEDRFARELRGLVDTLVG